MVGRELKPKEAGATLPEAALKVASWGVKRLSRWVMFSPHPLTISLPSPECLLLVRDREVHHKLKALVVGLSMYRAEFEIAKNPGTIAAELLQVAQSRPAGNEHRGVADLAHEPIAHVDVEIKLPRQTMRGPKPVDEARALKVHFDGRCVGRKGAGGMIAFDHLGNQVHGMAWYFGETAATNNEAEAEALLRTL
jgi:hypothetical protein